MRIAALAVLLTPALALADSVAVDVNVDVNVHTHEVGPVFIEQPPPPPPPRPILRGSHFELGAFLEFGRIAVDDIAGGQFGVRGEIARQLGPLRVAVEGSIAKFSAQRDLYNSMGWWNGWEDVGGETSRVGVSARLRMGMITEPSPAAPFRADLALYIEGGVGQQHIAWESGSSDERNDFMLGTGFEVAGGSERIGGFDLNVRAVVAPSLNASVETHDVTVLVGLGGRFGI